MPKRSAEHGEAVRSQILHGARRAFARGGLRGTNIPSIATEAGVSVGLIYRYFPSKDELFLELCLADAPERIRDLTDRLAPIEDPLERLRMAIDAHLDWLPDEVGAPLLLQALAAAPGDERVRALLGRRAEDLAAFGEWFVRDAIERGQLPRGTDPERLAAIAAFLLDGSVVRFAERGEAFDRQAVRDLIVEAIATAAGLSVDR
jgi:AcrR family transcriptional regulator